MPICNACHHSFPDYTELAKHIINARVGHRRGKRWASSVVLQVKRLDRKVTNDSKPDRIPLTEDLKETKLSLMREVSGEFRQVLCVCPRCKLGHVEAVEVEYIESRDAWRSTSGKPMIICGGCR